jgi:hypothetical protein
MFLISTNIVTKLNNFGFSIHFVSVCFRPEFVLYDKDESISWTFTPIRWSQTQPRKLFSHAQYEYCSLVQQQPTAFRLAVSLLVLSKDTCLYSYTERNSSSTSLALFSRRVKPDVPLLAFTVPRTSTTRCVHYSSHSALLTSFMDLSGSGKPPPLLCAVLSQARSSKRMIFSLIGRAAHSHALLYKNYLDTVLHVDDIYNLSRISHVCITVRTILLFYILLDYILFNKQ